MMSNVELVLPFLEKSAKVRSLTRVISTDDLFITHIISKMADAVNCNMEEINKLCKRVYNAFYVRPLNLIILNEQDYTIATVLKYCSAIKCVMTEVDYSQVASILSLQDTVNGLVAMYPEGNGVYSQPIMNTTFIDCSINGTEVREPFVESIWSASLRASEDMAIQGRSNQNLNKNVQFIWQEEVDESKLRTSDINESISLDSFKVINREDIAGVSTAESPQSIRLESYLTGGYQTNRVPLLVGPSAVAKSASVKALAEKHNMRLVDLRLAFTSRLDIEGLTSQVERNGVISSQSAPASFMVECCDAYIDYCSKAAAVVAEELEKSSNEDKPKLEAVLEKYKEGAKVPILFLDEITRAPASVRQAFTKILTDKSFMGYEMSYARVVAATNVALGAPEALADIYQTSDAGDAAFYDRFESIQITPDMVERDWFEWATSNNGGRQNVHSKVVEFLKANKRAIYDFEELVRIYNDTGDENDVTAAPYPNYRTWTMVSDYLYSVDEFTTKEISEDILTGLIGKSRGPQFYDWLIGTGEYVKKMPAKDQLTESLEESLNTGIPVMMITPSSIGKSSRVKALAKKRNALLIDINLAEQDRVDLLGPPVRVPIDKYISMGSGNLSQDVKDKLSELAKGLNLPSSVTIKAPKENIVRTLQEAAIQGREVIIHYDELNRVQNPAVMSAVFETISDARVLGVKFNPKNVRCIASCNLGENYSDAQAIDPAFSARFMMYKRTEYLQSDVDAFINYMKESKFSPEIIKYFESLPFDKARDIIASVETRSLELSAASTRAWEDLDKMIKDPVNQNVIKGTTFFLAESEANFYNDFVSSTTSFDRDKWERVDTTIQSKLDKWAAKNVKMNLLVSGAKVSVDDIIDVYTKARGIISDRINANEEPTPDEVAVYKNILLYMFKINKEVEASRRAIFKMALGTTSENFLSYYDAISGTMGDRIEIKDCVTNEIFTKYITQVLNENSSHEQGVIKVFQALKDFVGVFGNPGRDRARGALEASARGLIGVESSSMLIRMVSKTTELHDLLIEAEDNDIDWVLGFLQRCGIKVQREKISYVEKIIRKPRV